MYANKIKMGIASDSIVFVLTIIIGFAVIPLYLEYLSIEEFGVYISVQSIVAVISLADIGLTQYLTKKLSIDEFFESKNVKTKISTAQIFQYALAAFLLSIGLLVSLYITKILNVVSVHSYETSLLFLFSWFSVLVSVVFGLNHAIMRSRHEFQLMNYFNFSILVFTSGLNILFLYQQKSIIWMGISLLISTTAVNFFILFVVYNKYNIFILKTNGFDKEFFKKAWEYGTKFQVLRIAQVSKTSLFTVLLSMHAGQAIVAQYNVSNKVPALIPGFFSKVVMNFFPRFSTYLENAEIEKLREDYEIIFRYGIFLTIFIGLSTWVLNPSFVFVWVGKEMFINKYIFAFMVFSMIVMLFISYTGLIIHASGEFKIMPYIAILEILVFVLLSSVFYEFHGLIGFFVGFLVSILIGVSYTVYLVNNILKSNVLFWIFQDLSRLFIVAALIILIDFCVKSIFDRVYIQLCISVILLIPVFYFYSNKYINLRVQSRS